VNQPKQDTVQTGSLAPAAQPQPRKAETEPPGNPVFVTKNVSIYYSSFKAVTDVSLPIYENEITAFIGSSGSGKTTVLRAFNRMNDLVPGARVEGEVSDRTAFFSVLTDSKTDIRTGVLIEHGPTAQIFEDPRDSRTQAYVTGRIG